MNRIPILLLFLLTAFFLFPGCQKTVISRRLAAIQETHRSVPAGGAPFMKVHMKNGGVYVLTDWSYDDSLMTLRGTGTEYDGNRARVGAGPVSIPYEGVALLESNTIGQRSTSLTGLAFLTALSGGVTIFCATNPKACFGSCPTFYAWNGSAQELQAEGFSASIAPSLEAADCDALYDAQTSGPVFTLRVKNEALETHVIRRASLLAVPKPPRGRVFKSPTGEFYDALSIKPPSHVQSETGDVTELVRSPDAREYYSPADDVDLSTREDLELDFADVPDGPLGLVITSRQTLMTTFLLYQTLAYFGNSTGAWLAEVERGGPSAARRLNETGSILGMIDVLVQDDAGRWHTAGSAGETGPIARDHYVVPLGDCSHTGHLRLKVRMTRGFWRIDRLALAEIGRTVLPERMEPVDITSMGNDEFPPGSRWDLAHAPLVLLPGDEYVLTYRLPAGENALELFVESRGYYLEWIRSSWIEEENPEKVVQFLTEPAEYLRSLTPAYKLVESQMDEQFWNSRYAKLP